tara:strand:+ start:561 stop:923 length:363 start_codon:yes stop_codon:yes gene_type:complete
MKKDLIDKFNDKVAKFLNNLNIKHTVKSLLEKELGKEDFDRVIEYADEVILTHRPFSRAQALRWAFSWESTEEGYEYWERIHDQLFVKDMMDKKMSRIRKGILIGAVIVFIVCMYKLITL